MNHRDLFAIVDGGLLLHSYFSGVDLDGSHDTEGNKLHTPGHTIDNFSTRYLLPILEQVGARRVIVVWDAGHEYRAAVYPDYKIRRKDKSDELKEALNKTREAARTFLNHLGVLQCDVPGMEADDVIAYLAHKLPGAKMVYTGDNDLLQLGAVANTVVMIRGEPVNEGWRVKDMLVPFNRVALYKSMVGDSSDGYLGIRGFGPEKWKTLVETYDDDDISALQEAVSTDSYGAIQAVVAQQPGQHPIFEMLMDNLSQWRIGWALAQLHPEMVEARYSDQFKRIRWTKRLPSCREDFDLFLHGLGCGYLGERFDKYLPKRFILDADGFDLVEELAQARDIFAASPFVSIDLETWAPEHAPFKEAANGVYVDILSSKITGMGITCGTNLEYTFYATFDHRDSANLPQSVLIDLLDVIPEGVPVVAHNAAFERTVILNTLGCDVTHLHDTRLMASHVDETESLGLKDLARKWLRYEQTRYGDVVKDGQTMRDLSVHEVFSYGADDPFVTAHLYDLFYIILNLEGTWEFVRDNEFPAIYPISDGYLAGVEIDWQEMQRQADEDLVTYDNAMSTLHTLIDQNQTEELARAGAEQIFAETLPLEMAKIEKRAEAGLKAVSPLPQQAAEAALEQFKEAAVNDLRKEISGACRYARPVTVKEPVKFTLTKAQLNKVLLSLSLPEFTANTLGPRTITAYVRGAAVQTEVQRTAIDLLSGAAGYIKDAAAPEHAALVEFCKGVMAESVGTVVLGTSFNLDSPDQMSTLLYGMLALPIRFRGFEVSATRKKLGITVASAQANEDAIRMALAVDTPVGDWRRGVLLALLDAKKSATRRKMFYDKYPMWRHPLTGQVHPHINSVGTETRRPSGSNPNPLQWPKKGDGVKFRRCVLPNRRLGHDIVVSLDFDQEELRLAAGLSGDANMLSCYIGDNKRDLHSITGASIAKTSYEDFYRVVKDGGDGRHKAFVDIRKDAKNINFGSLYSIGPSKLARKLLCPVEVATAFLDAKYAAFPRYEAWKREVIDLAHTQGYVATLYGSRRHLHTTILSPDRGEQSSAERQGVNFLIQGLAADILKRVLRQCSDAQLFQRTGACLIAAIYDELVCSCHHTQVLPLIAGLHGFMTEGIKGLPVPILSSISLGPNFGDQHELGTEISEEKIAAAISKALGQPADPVQVAA